MATIVESKSKWYVVRAAGNKEKSVGEKLQKESEVGDLMGKVSRVIVPTETSFFLKNGKKVILAKVDKQYFRPLEVDYLKGDSKKAHKRLKFKPKYNLKSLIKEMINSDLILARQESRSKNY